MSIQPEAPDEIIRMAFERCPSGLIVVDESGRITVVNREVERQFGYTREELTGQSVEMLVPDDLAEGHSLLRAQYAARPIARQMGAGRELVGRRKNGSQIPVEIGLSTIATPKGLFVLATVVDVTERRRLEERLHQTHKLEALGTLASGIAHDINNILLGIMGYTELASKEASDPAAVVANLDVVLDTARRGRDLVNRILLFTRTTKTTRVPTDFEAPVHEAIQLLRATLPSNIEVREGFDPSNPRVMADGSELHQVAMNLATNAAHAMKDHGGVLEILLEPVSVDQPFATDHPGAHVGLHVRLRVTDTGTGIPPNVLDRIFEPFFTTKPQGEGTGLGLSVIDRIVHSMNGTIEVKSQVGEGTRVDVYIPAASADGSQARHGSANRSGRRGILLVDDEEGPSRLGKRVLEAAGFEVTAHTSSLEALETFRANPDRFDLLITDNKMPHMTGLELVAQILAIRPNTPVLMLSGVGESTSMEELNKRGVGRLLAKPYESSALRAAAEDMIETSPKPQRT